MTTSELAAYLCSLIGLSVDIESRINGRKIRGGPQLLIGVTHQHTHSKVWADFVDGTSTAVGSDGLRIWTSAVSDSDRTLFAECCQKGYYPNLPLNNRLQALLNDGVSA